MSTTHALKTWPPYFEDVESGRKSFEVRRADRPFQIGDVLELQEFDIHTEKLTGRTCRRRIVYVLADAEDFGVKRGYAVLGLEGT